MPGGAHMSVIFGMTFFLPSGKQNKGAADSSAFGLDF